MIMVRGAGPPGQPGQNGHARGLPYWPTSVIASWSPACELAVSFVSPFAELIVGPLTGVITSPLARPADRAGSRAKAGSA